MREKIESIIRVDHIIICQDELVETDVYRRSSLKYFDRLNMTIIDFLYSLIVRLP